jgi:uncharacterized membrane protein
MKKNLELFGGIVGSAIVFPSSILTVFTFLIASFFANAFKESEMEFKMQVIIILGILTMIGSFVSPAFTVVNYVKPENPVRKIMSLIVAVSGGLATLFLIFVLIKDFSFLLLLVLIPSIFLLLSGLLQAEIVKLPESME